MTDSSYQPADIAAFLQSRPDFFVEHADVFAGLQLPNPHGAHAISLSERQILTLRERTRALEWQLSELIQNARANQKISDAVTRFSQRLLAEHHAAALPGVITAGLTEFFGLESVALRLWGLSGQESPNSVRPGPNSPAVVVPLSARGNDAAPVSEDVRLFADSLQQPYCGRNTEFEAVSWLATPPASLALVALRLAPQEDSVGLLVLGSDDPERFGPDKGVTFLQTLGSILQAALTRLRPPESAVALETAG